MAVNKVIYGNTTLVDLTSDTVTADNMAAGVRATGADGTKIVGLLPKVAIDNELSLTSTNPVQNKTITAALSNLDIDIATNDEIDNALNLAGSGDLPTGGGGIVPIALGGTGATTTAGARTNLGVSATTDFAKVAFSGSYNDLTGTPTIPTATGDLTNNSGYITSSALNGYVKSVNGTSPDSNGNVSISVSGGSGGSVTVDAELSSTSTNAVQNKAVYAAVDKKLDKTGIAAYATRDSSGNVIINTYATKTDLNSYVKSINNVKPDSDGNVTISVGGGSGNYTLPTASSTLGGVKIGSGLTINTSGVVSADVTASTLTAYAKTTDLSAVAKSGSYNDLSNKPTIPSAYTLPNATSSTLGGVKVGSNINVSNGTISVTKSNVTSALGYTPATTNNASFTGTTMVQTLTVSSALNIPGGSIWIE